MNKNKKEDIIKDIMDRCDFSWNENGPLEYMEMVESVIENSYNELSPKEKEELYFEIEKRL